MRKRMDSIAFFVVTAILAFSLDYFSKGFAFQTVHANEGEYVLIPNWLSFIARENPQAMFSLGPADGTFANRLLSIVGSSAVVLLPLWAFWSLGPKQRGMGIVLGAILGGALGNLHDRLVFGGVRDFINAHYYDHYHFATFNVADSFLICGAILLVLTSILTVDPDSPAADTLNAPPSPI